MTQKSPTSWLVNPAAYANIWVYSQTGVTYNQTGFTYSGGVTGQNLASTKVPTTWSGL